jgi:hypothetical protein
MSILDLRLLVTPLVASTFLAHLAKGNASYQVSVHLAKRYQRRRFFKIGQSETIMAYGGHVC